MRSRLLPVLLAAVAALAVALLLDRGGAARGGARVERVVDGDTLRVSLDGRSRSVRLLGIDTPETHRPGTPVECGGPQASEHMESLAPPGTRVVLVSDPGQDRVDRYGRLLAYVRLPSGRLAEEAQLEAGWASVYVYAGKPVALYLRFRRAQEAARLHHRGVWAACGGRFHSAAP
jgi:micrococcal nuclease